MGFNGLFAAIELRARELADHLAAPIPPAWRKIDHINDAMHMSVSISLSFSCPFPHYLGSVMSVHT